MVERAENGASSVAPESGPAGIPRKRIHSEIEFPYSDLQAAVELAGIIREKAGSACEDRELAGWLNQSVDGGTYRSRRSSARLFGLITISQGRLTLTDLGHNITDGAKSPAARTEAFLRPELYSKMYELHGGKLLPPPAAIEREMGELGVSPKQKERARQVFSKSATYAGFIDSSTGRFVKPAADAIHTSKNDFKENSDEANGRDGGRGDGIDPIIQGLLARLPKSGEVWPEAERKLWLDLLAGSFKLIYESAEDSG